MKYIGWGTLVVVLWFVVGAGVLAWLEGRYSPRFREWIEYGRKNIDSAIPFLLLASWPITTWFVILHGDDFRAGEPSE